MISARAARRARVLLIWYTSLSSPGKQLDDGKDKDNATNQLFDWLNEKNNRAARAARTLAQCQIATWHLQIKDFNDNVNLSFPIVTSKVLVPVNL